MAWVWGVACSFPDQWKMEMCSAILFVMKLQTLDLKGSSDAQVDMIR